MEELEMVRLGIIGTGGMAAAHAKAFSAIPGCKVAACADIVPGKAEAFARTHNIPAFYTSAEAMLESEKLDAVSVVTPDRAHAPVSLLALRHGLHVMCEKPLASTYAEARRMAAEAKKRRVLTAVNFSYRNSPATQKAAQIAASGRLGRIMHVEGRYLQSWLAHMDFFSKEIRPAALWRLSTRHGSAGVLGDLGVHLYDLAYFVVGEFDEIMCELKTFKKPRNRIGEYVFDANDSALAIVRFRNGAVGTLHTTRWATGHSNTVGIRVHGDRGALDLDLDRPPDDQLRLFFPDDKGWRSVKCPGTPNMYERFIRAIKTGKQGQTSFEGGARVQSYLDCAMKSAERGGFVKIPRH
jgi:predicted dehydrogenase